MTITETLVNKVERVRAINDALDILFFSMKETTRANVKGFMLLDHAMDYLEQQRTILEF